MGVKPQESKLADPGLGPASLPLETPGQLAPLETPKVVKGEQVPKHCEVAAGEQLVGPTAVKGTIPHNCHFVRYFIHYWSLYLMPLKQAVNNSWAS